MNKTQAIKSGNHHSHVHDSQDNCDSCQQQRRQNNMLVDFYQRLNKIETKVDKMKDNVASQQEKRNGYRQRIQEMNQVLLNKPEEILRQIKQHDSKEMGYELASALIEREIKTKMENQRLQSIIEQLQKDKLRLQEQKKNHYMQDNIRLNHPSNIQRSVISNNTQSHYSDVIDEVHNTNDSSYFLQKKKEKDMRNSYFQQQESKRYWEDTSNDQEQTNFSNFIVVNKQKSKSEDRHQYDGLNLWLYQFNTQQLEQTPIKSLRKPINRKMANNRQVHARNKSTF